MAPHADSTPDPDTELVQVFGTTEAALIPLVQLTLTEAGIEHTTWNRGMERILGRRSSMSVGETDAPLQVFVRQDDEGRARSLLAELEERGQLVAPVQAAEAAPDAPSSIEAGAVTLYDAATGARIGRVSDLQFATLAANLVRESEDDDDYYIDQATLTLLQDQKADAAAVELLRRALGSREGMDVRWERNG